MKELFYFSFADLMARIEYHQTANSLRYATHREMTVSERVAVEQYLLTGFAMKTEYYKRQPAHFAYLGTDKQLIKALRTFQSQGASCVLEAGNVDDSVSRLISRSMQNYYFEQIGDTILQARRELDNTADERYSPPQFSFENVQANRGRRKVKLQELVEAYNLYADQKIDISEIIPAELKTYFGISAEREHFQTDLAARKSEPIAWDEEKL